MDEMVTSGHVPGRRQSFLVLVMLILAIGARYATESDTEEYCSTLELASLRSKLMAKVEEKFLDIFDEGDIEMVTSGHVPGCKSAFYWRLTTYITGDPRGLLLSSVLA